MQIRDCPAFISNYFSFQSKLRAKSNDHAQAFENMSCHPQKQTCRDSAMLQGDMKATLCSYLGFCFTKSRRC